MFTQIYHNDHPNPLHPYTAGKRRLEPADTDRQHNAIHGHRGAAEDEVCAYLSKPDPQIEVWPNLILNRSTESTASGKLSVIL